jgi:P27 family predicted phage terminase small subunit
MTEKAPSNLTPYAADEWERLAPLARQLGTLTEVTARSFEVLVETLGTERRARELVERHGMVTRTGHGAGSKPYPAVRAMETARTQAAVLLKLFRLDPDGQAAAGPVKADDKPKSDWEGVLK